MTYLEKLKKEHPDCIARYDYSKYCGCPWTFGYEAQKDGLCGMDRNNVNYDTCQACWNREMKITGTKKGFNIWK